MFCNYCVVQFRKGNLKDQRAKEDTYITKGFSSWKKALKCFQAHQDSAWHKAASSYQLIIPRCHDAHTDVVDKLSLVEVAERFTATQDKRRNDFETFTESDL